MQRTVRWINRSAIAATVALVCTAGWLGWQSASSMRQMPEFASGSRARPSELNNSVGRRGFLGGIAPSAVDPIRDSAGARDLLVQAPLTSPGLESKLAEAVRPSMPTAGFKDEGEADDVRMASPSRSGEQVVNAPAAAPVAALEAETKAADSEEAETPVEESMPIDRRLWANNLTNEAMQNASFRSISNQIELVADPATCESLVDTIARFAADNQVPDARVTRLDEPISPTQQFVMVGRVNQNYVSANRLGESAYVLNLEKGQLADLLARLDAAVGANRANLQVLANGRELKNISEANRLVVPAVVARADADPFAARAEYAQPRPDAEAMLEPQASKKATGSAFGKEGKATDARAHEKTTPVGGRGGGRAVTQRTREAPPAIAKRVEREADRRKESAESQPPGRKSKITTTEPAEDLGRPGTPRDSRGRNVRVRSRTARPVPQRPAEVRRKITDDDESASASDFVTLAIAIRPSTDAVIQMRRRAAGAPKAPEPRSRPASRPATTQGSPGG